MLQDRADNSQFAKLKIALIGLFCYIASKADAIALRSRRAELLRVATYRLLCVCWYNKIYSTEPEITQATAPAYTPGDRASPAPQGHSTLLRSAV